jgi:hypothetical protein
MPGVKQSIRIQPWAYCSEPRELSTKRRRRRQLVMLVTGRGDVPITSERARSLAEELIEAATKAESQHGRTVP